MSGTNAVAWAVGASTPHSSLPSWPAYAFGVMTLAALYVLGAALTRIWPFHRLALTPAELLDDCIRGGLDTRAQVMHGRLDGWEVEGEAAAWTLRTAKLLHEQFPAVVDEFLAATGDEQQLSGQALTVQTLAVKLAVLAAARRELTG